MSVRPVKVAPAIPTRATTLRAGVVRPTSVQQVLHRAVTYWRADCADGSQLLRDLSGNGHHAQLGSTSGADSNDPLLLQMYEGKPYLYLPGIAANFASVPDAAALGVTGDIDLRARYSLDDWTPAAISILGSKFAAAGTRSYQLDITTGGAIRLVWSNDGTAILTATSDALGLVDGSVKWVRATLDVDNGAGGYTVTFLKSDDGSAWTQVGAPVVGGATTSIFASTSIMSFGASPDGTSNTVAGKAFQFQVYNGIAGTKVLDVDFTNPTTYNATRTSLTAVTGQTVTINRATSGRKSSVVDRPLFLLGTDDYFEVPDHADLNITLSNEFTVAVAGRFYGTPATSACLIQKQAAFGSAGWSYRFGAATDPTFRLHDGTNQTNTVAPSPSAGVPFVISARRALDPGIVGGFTNGVVGTTQTDNATATLSNAAVLQIGRSPSAGFLDFEFFGAAIFRDALSTADIARLNIEMGAI